MSFWQIGAGNMGRAMLAGWARANALPPGLIVVDPGEPELPGGGRARAGLPSSVPDTLLLAVKPQLFGAVAAELRPRLAADTVVMSVLAGTPLAMLRAGLGVERVVRLMPNLPVALGQGVVLGVTETAGARDEVAALMAPLGLFEWLTDEVQLDAATALSGCGPAFAYRFLQGLTDAAVGLGIEPAQARRLAQATVAGATAAAAASGDSLGAMADAVASRGGATRAGLDVLDRDGALAQLLAETLAAAHRRTLELGR